MPGIDVVGARAAGLRPIVMDPYGFNAGADYARVTSLVEVAVDDQRELSSTRKSATNSGRLRNGEWLVGQSIELPIARRVRTLQGGRERAILGAHDVRRRLLAPADGGHCVAQRSERLRSQPIDRRARGLRLAVVVERRDRQLGVERQHAVADADRRVERGTNFTSGQLVVAGGLPDLEREGGEIHEVPRRSACVPASVTTAPP